MKRTPSRQHLFHDMGDQWFLVYKYRRRQFDPMLRRYLFDRRLEQSHIPMHTVTVDLVTGNVIVRDQGDAVHAITESINLPVLAKPICRNGQMLVNGGLINNVPANELAARGCNVVIAVSVTSKIEKDFANNRPDTLTHDMRSASTIQTVLRSYVVQSKNMNAVGLQPADVIIEPDVSGYELTAFGKTDELAAIGEKAANRAIPSIRKVLANLDPVQFGA